MNGCSDTSNTDCARDQALIQQLLHEFASGFTTIVSSMPNIAEGRSIKKLLLARKPQTDELQLTYTRIVHRVLLVVLQCDLAKSTCYLEGVEQNLDTVMSTKGSVHTTGWLNLLDPQQTRSLAQASADTCTQCFRPLREECLLIDDHPVHLQCLKCHRCGRLSADSTLFANQWSWSWVKLPSGKGVYICPLHANTNTATDPFGLHRPLSNLETDLYVCMVRYSKLGQTSPLITECVWSANAIL